MIYIARIYNNYTEKFGIPRQSGLVGNSLSKIVFEPDFRNMGILGSGKERRGGRYRLASDGPPAEARGE